VCGVRSETLSMRGRRAYLTVVMKLEVEGWLSREECKQLLSGDTYGRKERRPELGGLAP